MQTQEQNIMTDKLRRKLIMEFSLASIELCDNDKGLWHADLCHVAERLETAAMYLEELKELIPDPNHPASPDKESIF